MKPFSWGEPSLKEANSKPLLRFPVESWPACWSWPFVSGLYILLLLHHLERCCLLSKYFAISSTSTFLSFPKKPRGSAFVSGARFAWRWRRMIRSAVDRSGQRGRAKTSYHVTHRQISWMLLGCSNTQLSKYNSATLDPYPPPHSCNSHHHTCGLRGHPLS